MRLHTLRRRPKINHVYSAICHHSRILLSEYLREYVGKPEYPIPFSLSFSLSRSAGPLPPLYRIWPLIHSVTNSTTNPISSSVSGRPFSIRSHFHIHPRQHVAVVCWAMKTGMPIQRGLLTIIFWEGRWQSGRDEIKGVEADGVDALVLDVLAVLVRQFEAGGEFRFFKSA